MLNTQKKDQRDQNQNQTRRDTPRHFPEKLLKSHLHVLCEREREIEGEKDREGMCLRSVTVVNRKRMSVACKVTNVMKYSIGQHQQRERERDLYFFGYSLQAVKFLE